MATSTATATSNSKIAAESYIGSFISLISKYEIRYEGLLYHLNVHDSTIGLKNVRSYGTEGRKKDGPQIPPSEKVYEYILFRGSDIKDLEVKSSPASKKEEQIFEDPAIIQSQYAGVPMNSPPPTSVGDKTLKESSPWQDTPALTTRTNPGALPPSYQPVTQVASLNQSQVIQSAGAPAFSAPVYWQGYNGTSANSSYSPQHSIPFQSPSTASSPMMVQNGVQTSELEASPVSGLITASRCGTHMPPSTASTSSHHNFSPTLTPAQCSTTPAMPLSSSFKASLPSSAAYMTDPNLTMSSVTSTCQDTKAIQAQFAARAVSDPLVVHPAQPMPYPASPFLGSASGPLLTPSPSLLTPDQLVPSGPPVLSSTQKMYFDKNGIGAIPPVTSNPPLAASMQVNQAPLLPLPTSSQQSQHSTTQFTEEFDFEAMNEKFKKNEVWGYLGKKKQQNTEDIEENGTDQSLGDKEAHWPTNNFDPKPAYKKDDFFDTISCNSLTRGTRDAQNRFSERMKLDTETFGNFRQRPPLNYGGYGAGRGQNYRGTYTGGRGYGYGWRGRGGNTHF